MNPYQLQDDIGEINIDDLLAPFDEPNISTQPSLPLQQTQQNTFGLDCAPSLGLMTQGSIDMINAGAMQFVGLNAPTIVNPAIVNPAIVVTNPLLQVTSGSTEDFLPSGDDMDIISEDPTYRASKSKKNRTPQQQKKNKLAQQRYRERKKEKYGQLEKAVGILTQKAEKLDEVQHDNAQLRGQNETLTREISELQYEVSRLRTQVTQQQQFGVKRIDTQIQEARKEREQNERAFCELKQMIGKHKLNPPSESNLYNMSYEDSKLFGKLVSTCLLASVNGYLLNCNKISQYEQISVDEYENLILRSIQMLNLSSKQVDQIISYRAQFLSQMQNSHKQREKLNFQIMSFLVSSSQQNIQDGAKLSFDAEGKILGVQQKLQNDMKLQIALEQLQLLIMENKRTYDEFVGHVVKEVLGIAQRGILVSMIYPHPFDVLAIADIVYKERELVRTSNSSHSTSSNIYVEVLTV
eukprot:TRINITY_DN17779_c0_g1_i2.p1 TRINITY_DN17779_c0_g1~~TRINITY_DN17779_c0_g1_i2.p1  ORF type:complete len:466 (-),score=52.93 TRINITY_DN17779_c0_g1_i2:473-1870(-)